MGTEGLRNYPKADCQGLLLVGLGLVQSRAQDVAERSARIAGTELRDRFLLFRDLEGLDREGHATRLAVELGDARIDLLAGGETLGTLITTVASKLVTLDERGEVGVDDLHFDAAILHLENLAGDDLALLEFAGFREGVAAEL